MPHPRELPRSQVWNCEGEKERAGDDRLPSTPNATMCSNEGDANPNTPTRAEHSREDLRIFPIARMKERKRERARERSVGAVKSHAPVTIRHDIFGSCGPNSPVLANRALKSTYSGFFLTFG